MENTLHCNYTVSSYEINPKGQARLTALANYLQETAYKHANSLGLGYHDLAEENVAWILSRMKIRVLEYPAWDDTLRIETWPHGIEKLFALRDFRIFNSEGKKIAEATTNWLMVDINTHRPLRIPPDFIKIKVRTDGVFASSPGKITLPDEMEHVRIHEVGYSDLDIVGHVNNVKFVEWCVDTLSIEHIMERGVTAFEINYLSEARPGDKVEIFSSGIEDSDIYILGKNSESDKECFRAKMTF